MDEIDAVAVALRFLHIVFGVAWIGAVLYAVGVLRVALPRVDPPARMATMRQLLPVAVHYVPMSAVMTILSGAVLYLYLGSFDTAILVGTEWGRALLGALVLTLGTFLYGMIVAIGNAKKILGHLNEPACDHPQEVGALGKRFNRAQVFVLVLGLVIIGLMVYAAEVLHPH